MKKCLLCNHETAYAIPFKQLYKQYPSDFVALDWYACKNCGGWFNTPAPSPEQIASYWKTVAYNDPKKEGDYLTHKLSLYKRILKLVNKKNNHQNKILDFGSNFGQFLDLAKQQGWQTFGFEPFHDAAEISRTKGHHIVEDFEIEKAFKQSDKFATIVANDSFCYSWHPYETMRTFHAIMEDNGKLIMRLSNKKTIINMVNSLSRNGQKKNQRISSILQAQFHTIDIKELAKICKAIGFKNTEIKIAVNTTPFLKSSLKTNIAYHLSTIIYYLTLKKINLSPGVLLIAEK